MKILVLIVGVALVAVACGSSGKDLAEVDEQTATTESGTEPYPPNNDEGLAAFLNPIVEPYGLRFSYGSLNDTSDGGYELSDTGNHLALYVEPVGEYSDEDYINALYDVTAAATPVVFESWEGLTSYDICQEQRPEDSDLDPAPPATQINIERDAAESFDWANGDLESMRIYQNEVGPEEFSIIVAAPLSLPLLD